MSNQNTIQLVIVDDDSKTRNIYKTLLTSHVRLKSVWSENILEATQANQIIELLNKVEPNKNILVVSDAYMPPNCDGSTVKIPEQLFGGFWLIDKIRRTPSLTNRTKILMVTFLEDDPLVKSYIHGNKSDIFPYIRNKDFYFVPKPLASLNTQPIEERVMMLNQRATNLEDALFKQTFDAVFDIIGQRSDEGQSVPRSIVSTSKKMEDVLGLIDKAAKSTATVLIFGESGTGKELVAKEIHKNSSRRDHKFIPVNCTAIPDSLFESELFGHEKGAFTGAAKMKRGKFELADKGTLFLDEIGELSLEHQAKLLRAIQEKSISRVGSENEIELDVRLIAATNRNLVEKINEKQFREDLFYRLNVVEITLPPLRERKEDIIPLAKYFLSQYTAQDDHLVELTSEAFTVLQEQDWYGNIRQLQHFIEKLVVLSNKPKLGKDDVQIYLSNTTVLEPKYNRKVLFHEVIDLDELKYEYAKFMLESFSNNKTQASKAAGIDTDTLSKMFNQRKSKN